MQLSRLQLTQVTSYPPPTPPPPHPQPNQESKLKSRWRYFSGNESKDPPPRLPPFTAIQRRSLIKYTIFTDDLRPWIPSLSFFQASPPFWACVTCPEIKLFLRKTWAQAFQIIGNYCLWMSGWDLAELWMRSIRVVDEIYPSCAWDLAKYGWDLVEWLERLTANAAVATVLGSIPASSDTVESEGRQMKQCWISYIDGKNIIACLLQYIRYTSTRIYNILWIKTRK